MSKVTASSAFKDYLKANMATEHVLFTKDFAAFLERQESLYRDLLARVDTK